MSKRSLFDTALHIAIVTVIALCALAIAFAARAHAAVGDDPASDAAWILSQWNAGNIAQALIVGSFVVLRYARRYVPWLQTGYRALWISAAIAALTGIAESAVTGALPSAPTIAAAVLQFIGHVLDAKLAPIAPKAAPAP